MDWQNLLYFLFWVALFVVMMRFGCGAHVMGHHHNDNARSSGGDHNEAWAPPAHSTDPVCGKVVDTASAKSALYRGQAYFFCSQDCRDKFEQNPSGYERAAAAPQHQETHHGCC